MERDYRKGEYCQIFQQCFNTRVNQIEWLFSKEQNKGSAYETKIQDKEH